MSFVSTVCYQCRAGPGQASQSGRQAGESKHAIRIPSQKERDKEKHGKSGFVESFESFSQPNKYQLRQSKAEQSGTVEVPNSKQNELIFLWPLW